MTKTNSKRRRKSTFKRLKPIWEVPDAWWERKKTGKDPTDRGKEGTKKSMGVEGQGGPVGVGIAGANVLERGLLKATIEAIVVERPEPTAADPQHLCLDGGYDNPTGRKAA